MEFVTDAWRGFSERVAFSYVDVESRVPAGHPLRQIRTIVNESLAALSPIFDAIYSAHGRPSIPPEQLLRALLLQAFYSVRSERQLMERLDFDILFRWFVGIGLDAPVWDASSFSKNRDRLLAGDVAVAFLNAIMAHKKVRGLLSQDHFSVDGTLVGAWASMKSFKPKDGSGGDGDGSDFRGQTRSNDSHASTTDPDAMLYRKNPGHGAKLCYLGHLLTENRHSLIVDTRLTKVSGHAERLAAQEMLEDVSNDARRITVGGDKGFDTKGFVMECREMNVTPHVAQNDTRPGGSAIDGRTTRHNSYKVSLRLRKQIEERFGWMKTYGGQAKTKFRGRERVAWAFTFAAAACNLIRLPKLMEMAA